MRLPFRTVAPHPGVVRGLCLSLSLPSPVTCSHISLFPPSQDCLIAGATILKVQHLSPCLRSKRPPVTKAETALPSTPPAAWSCPLPTLPASWEGFLEAGLVACFLLMFNIFSSPRTRCCSSSGRLWSGKKRRQHGVEYVVPRLCLCCPRGLAHQPLPGLSLPTALPEGTLTSRKRSRSTS